MSRSIPPRPDVSASDVEDRRPKATWRWWEVVAFTVFAWLVAGIVVLPLVAALRPSADEPLGGAGLLIGLVSNSVVVGVLVLWLRSAHPGWWHIVGWPPRRQVVREVAVGAGLGILVRIGAAVVAAIVVAALRGVSHDPVDLPPQISTDLGTWGLVTFALFAVVSAPFTEELMFRALLFRSIADRIGFWPGAAVSAVAFGAYHLLTPGDGLDVLALGITHVGTGLGLAWIYWRRRNLLANVAGHATFNLIAVIAVIAGVEL